MGANLGSGQDKRAVNVELNLVPFIDLMSCLVAFLLFTSIWVGIAQLDTRAQQRSTKRGLDGTAVPHVQLSVLVDADGIWIGESEAGTFERIPGRDWAAFDKALAAHKASAAFIDRNDLQLAAESTAQKFVPYQDLIVAMDIAHRVGFDDVAVTDPRALDARPTL
jgi:biopolymer transport protein TolR